MSDVDQFFIKDEVTDYTTDLEQLFTSALYDRIQALKETRDQKQRKIEVLRRAVEEDRRKWLDALQETKAQYRAVDEEIKRLTVIWKDRVITRRVYGPGEFPHEEA